MCRMSRQPGCVGFEVEPRRIDVLRRWAGRTAGAAVAGALLVLGAAVPPAASAADAPVLTDRGEAAALVVQVETQCSELRVRGSEAVVRWSVDVSEVPKSSLANELVEAREFRIDLSPYPRGLERGEFKTLRVPEGSVADPTALVDLPKNAVHPNAGREMLLGDLQPGVSYRARVLALTSEGWLASDQVMFRAPICPVDMAERAAGGER